MIKQNEGRFVIVANAEPYQHKIKNGRICCEEVGGGLTTGLKPLMKETNGIWIAWGRGDEDFNEKVVDKKNKVKVPDKEEVGESEKFTLKRVNLSREEVGGFYRGFSNRTLWPVFHSFPGKCVFKEKYWNAYKKVNQKYSKATVEELQPEDKVWIQDYHLTLLPKMIRNEKESKIAFFLHIPWPPWEIYGKIPWKREILEGLSGCDFIGMHRPSYRRNLLHCIEKVGGKVDWKENTFYLEESKTKVASIPLGINYKWFNSLKTHRKENELKAKFHAKHLIFGVDRLDYTKGILERVYAFERFLEENPKYRGNTTLIQRISLSRTGIKEYKDMNDKISMEIGRVNGKFQKEKWIPIRHFYGGIPQSELIKWYRACDIALITPGIDGMNLVSKEYIASQNDGVLILSEFAGSADQLKEAVIVNPYNIEQTSKAIKTALEMNPEERKRKFQKLKESVKKYDLNWWRNKFLEEWEKAC